MSMQDQDAIDFTDNDIPSLGNFPLNPRLQSLYLGRNRIGSIAPALAKSIPNVSTVVLTQNQLTELADLEPLLELPKLTHLSLLENPVTSKEVCHNTFKGPRIVRAEELIRDRTTDTGSYRAVPPCASSTLPKSRTRNGVKRPTYLGRARNLTRPRKRCVLTRTPPPSVCPSANICFSDPNSPLRQIPLFRTNTKYKRHWLQSLQRAPLRQ